MYKYIITQILAENMAKIAGMAFQSYLVIELSLQDPSMKTQVFPVILTRGQNKKKCPNKSWAVFKYLWVGKV